MLPCDLLVTCPGCNNTFSQRHGIDFSTPPAIPSAQVVVIQHTWMDETYRNLWKQQSYFVYIFNGTILEQEQLFVAGTSKSLLLALLLVGGFWRGRAERMCERFVRQSRSDPSEVGVWEQERSLSRNSTNPSAGRGCLSAWAGCPAWTFNQYITEKAAILYTAVPFIDMEWFMHGRTQLCRQRARHA